MLMDFLPDHCHDSGCLLLGVQGKGDFYHGEREVEHICRRIQVLAEIHALLGQGEALTIHCLAFLFQIILNYDNLKLLRLTESVACAA